MQHCLSCKEGGVVSIRHNNLRDLATKMLSNVWKEIEPKLTLLTQIRQRVNNRTANKKNEASLDIRPCRVWERGQPAFLY